MNLAGLFRALDKREHLIIIFLISHQNHNYVVTPHLNCLVELEWGVTTYVFNF